MTNIERIKNMETEEFAEFIIESACNHCTFHDDPEHCDTIPCVYGVIKWLNEEVENEE